MVGINHARSAVRPDGGPTISVSTCVGGAEGTSSAIHGTSHVRSVPETGWRIDPLLWIRSIISSSLRIT